MARPTRAALIAELDRTLDEEAGANLLYTLLGSATNPDGSPFALPAGEALAQSLAVTGTVTAPTAGQAIATLAAPPAGSYLVRVLAGYGASASTLNNLDVRAGGAALTVLPVLAVADRLAEVVLRRVDLSGSQALTVNAVAAGAAGTIFVAHITATRIAA